MPPTRKQIMRVYKKREKAYDTILNCDIALDLMLKILMKK